jgi:hypothetical protein
MDGFLAIVALFLWIDFFSPLFVWICFLRHMRTKARRFGRPKLITQERKKEKKKEEREVE